MKKLILALAVVALLVLGGITAVAVLNRYHNYQANQKLKVEQATAAANAKNVADKNALEGEITTLNATVAHLQSECQKGSAAYGKLTLSLQKTTPAPTCS